MAKKKRTNPYGANQWQVDPRQALFLKAYLNPKSKTFSNAYQSAMAVGYTEEYAAQILSKDLDWLTESVRSEDMVRKAELVLDEMLVMEAHDPAEKRIKQDTAKFVTSRLGKKKWSERVEHTGEDGAPLMINIVRSEDKNGDTNDQSS